MLDLIELGSDDSMDITNEDKQRKEAKFQTQSLRKKPKETFFTRKAPR